MKFDIVRAWKDEAYRQTLSDEQLSSLPASPVGELELTSTELQSVNGGQLGGGIFGARLSHFDFHSLAFECNENTFSIVFNSGLNINSETQVHCTNHSNNHQNDEQRDDLR